MRKEPYLVTGAPGWLGTRLVEILCKKKYNVRCLVLKDIDASELKNLGVKIVRGDVTDKSSLAEAVNDVDTIIHCAGIIHPRKIKDLFLVNTEGTRNLLKTAVEAAVKKFIYISSSVAQGTNIEPDVLLREHDPCNPYMMYGKSKWLAEQVVRDFHRQDKIKTIIIRPCWYYGIRQPEKQTKLMKMIKKGHPLIFGDGKNLRNMTYIDNLVDGIILADSTKKAEGETYWIADERPYTTLEIYETIAEILNVKIKPIFIPKFISRMLRLMNSILDRIGINIMSIRAGGEMSENIACSIDKAKKELGYKPKIELKEGMKKSIEWVVQNNLL